MVEGKELLKRMFPDDGHWKLQEIVSTLSWFALKIHICCGLIQLKPFVQNSFKTSHRPFWDWSSQNLILVLSFQFFIDYPIQVLV